MIGIQMIDTPRYLTASRLKHLWQSLAADTRGNVSLMTSVAALPFLVVAGMAMDFSRSHNYDLDMQAALDSAALAAAAAYDKTDSEREQLAKDMFAANFTDVNNPPIPSVAISADEVTVSASYNVDTSLMKLSGLNQVQVNSTSTAISGANAGPCILTLDPTEKESIMLNSDSEIVADGCLVQVNSSDDEALRGNSDGDLTAEKICVHGDWVNDGSSQFDPEPSHCSPIADPLASLPVPDEADDPCDETDFKVESDTTLNPGVYCDKFEINGDVDVIFNPGIYVIRDGEFILNSGATATGSNVMFYLTGGNNTRFNFNSDSHVEFHGRVAGDHAGIVFFQARDSDADFSILNSDSSSIIEGVIYLSNTPLHLNSYGNISDSSPWSAIVVKTLEVNSHSTLHINVNYELSTVPVPFGIGGDPSQQIVRLKE